MKLALETPGTSAGYWKARKMPARERSSTLMASRLMAVHGDGAAGDDVAFVAGDHLREGRFAGAVRAHDGVDLAGGDLKGDALEDFGAVFEGGVEVGDEQRHGRLGY
jgi:hypothetical protein